jgi:hypothetical protein
MVMGYLDPRNTDAKACRYWGGRITIAALIGEIGCGIGYLAGGNTKAIEIAAKALLVCGAIGAISLRGWICSGI